MKDFHQNSLYHGLHMTSELQNQGKKMSAKCMFEKTISCSTANEGNCMFIRFKDKRLEWAHEN